MIRQIYGEHSGHLFGGSNGVFFDVSGAGGLDVGGYPNFWKGFDASRVVPTGPQNAPITVSERWMRRVA